MGDKMKKSPKQLIPVIIIVVIIVVIIAIFASSYNQLVASNEKVEGKYADISVQLERRADLIPNLVNTVKGYMEHEENVINSVTKARENLVNAKDLDEKSTANEELTSALNNLFVMAIAEGYPDLKANTNFINLQDELAGTENRIAVSRKDYNDAVKEYNITIKKFPKNMIAGMFGFETKDYFEAKETSLEVPNVSFEQD